MNIDFRTKRQFERVLQREGKEVKEFLTKQTAKVIFRRGKNGKGTDRNVRIYYAKDSVLTKGSCC